MTKEQLPSTNKEILNVAPFPALIVNAQGQLLQWNESSITSFGYTAADFSSQPETYVTNTLFSPVAPQIWQTIISSTQPLRLDNVQLLAKNEQLVEVSLLTKPGIFNNEAAFFLQFIPYWIYLC